MSHKIMGGGASIITSPTPKRMATRQGVSAIRIERQETQEEAMARLGINSVVPDGIGTSRPGDIYTPMDDAQVEVCIKPCKLYLWGREDGPDLCRRITLWYEALSDRHMLIGQMDGAVVCEVGGSRHDLINILTNWAGQDALVWREEMRQRYADDNTPA